MIEDSRTKQCIACQAEIPLNASVCSKCSTHQNQLVNIFQSAGRVVGVFSAILAFASYVISSAPAVRQAIAWQDDINVLSYSDERVVIGNKGDGEVFVSYVFIRTETDTTTIRSINRMVAVDEIATVELSSFKETFTVVAGLTDAEWEQYQYLDGSDNDNGQCITINFFSESDPELRLYSDALGDDLRKVNATATIYYFSNKLGVELSKQFPVYGVLYEFDKSCDELGG